MAKHEKVIKEVSEEISESSENKEVEKAEAIEEPLKPYMHVDTFLQTAIPLYGLNSMQAAGFRGRMNGRHYQRDEQIFLQELKQYLNLK